MKTILAPIDFSDGTETVIAEAVALAQATHARLVLLHVIPPLPGDTGEFVPAFATKAGPGAGGLAPPRSGCLQGQPDGDGITVSTLYAVGLSGPTILAGASELSADYIVMGSHGQGAFHGPAVGSTTRRVLQAATCPVLVIPPGLAAVGQAAALDLKPAEAAEA